MSLSVVVEAYAGIVYFLRGALLSALRDSRRVLGAVFALLFLVAASHAAAQNATLNDGSNPTFSSLNSTSTSPVTITNVGTEPGGDPWRDATFRFEAQVTGSAVWSGGVQFQTQNGIEQIWNQPRITEFGTSNGEYQMIFSRPVEGLTFYHGGLDNGDTVLVTAFNGGVPVPLPTSYFDAFTGGVFVETFGTNFVQMRGNSGGSGDERAREYRVTFPAGVFVDEVRFEVGKPAGSNNNNTVTLAHYLFDWLPIDPPNTTLPAPDSCTELTTTWSGGGTTFSSTTSDGVNVSTAISLPAGTNWSNFGNDGFNTIPAWSEAIGGTNALSSVMFWDTTPGDAGEDADIDAATAQFTVNFSVPVLNPVLHIDRIGGAGGYIGRIGTPANSSEWTLTTPGAAITAATGTPHFKVVGNSFFRRPFQQTVNASQSSTDPTQGTAAGSIQVDGIYSSLTFDVTGVGTEGSGADGIELIFCAPAAIPPTADDDTNDTPANVGQTVSIDVLDGDADADGTVDPTTVSLVTPSGATDVVTDANGDVIGFEVPGEGVWSVDETNGEVTFAPEPGFANEPTPIRYTVADNDGLRSNQATISVSYILPPVAQDDVSAGNPVGPVTVDLVADDTDPDGTVDPTRVSLVTPTGATGVVTDANGDVIGFAVPGEGTWAVNESSGEATFTPEPGFVGDPTPVDYTVRDDDGLLSNVATITIGYADVAPSIALMKSITAIADTNSSGQLDAGDTVTYSFAVENTGDTSLADIDLTDTGLSPITVTPDPVFDGDLSPVDGPTVIATATYVLTAVDVVNGGVENVADVSATPVATSAGGDPIPGAPLFEEGGSPLADVTDTSDAGTEPTIDQVTGLPAPIGSPAGTETVDLSGATDGDLGNDPTVLPLPAPDIRLTKSVASYDDTNTNGIVDVGDTVTYSFVVANTGRTDLTDVVIADSLPGVIVSGSPIVSLPEGATNTSVSATYQLQPADIDAGTVENSATVTGTAVDGNGDPFADPFNPGNPVTVSDVSDTGTDPDGDPVIANELVETPGAGGATDSDPTNDPTVFAITPSPSLEVIKSIAAVNDLNANGILDANDTIDYAFEVTNTGNVDLADVTINDPIVNVSGGPVDLAIGATDAATFTATYTIDADDVAAGGVENTAVAEGDAVDASGDPITDPITGVPLTASDDSDSGSEPLLNASGDPVDAASPATTESPALDGSTDSDPTNDPTVLIIPNPELTLVKSLANAFDDNVPGGDGLFGGEGDTLSYQFTVTNTGNVDLQNVTITDPAVAMAGGPIDLDVGAGDSLTFTATHTVLPADITRGHFENTATATGDAVDASGDPIFGPTGTPLTATDVSDTGTDPEGDTITDPGNVEQDPNANPNITGASTPDGILDNDPTVSKIPGNPNPQISVIKSVASVADTSGDGMIGEGDTVTYSFSVTNTGNLDLADVTVTDPLANVSGGPISLALGATDSATFTATSVITAAQAAAGAVENSAQATGGAVNSLGTPITDPATGLQRTATDTSDAGTDPDVGVSGTPTSYADPEGNETPDASDGTDSDPTNDPTVLFLPMPELTVTKSVASVADTNANGFTDAGDTVSYTFAVTNTGNTDLINVDVTDALPGITVVGSPIAALVQGATDTNVTATYVLTTGDIEAGTVQNTAEATGIAVDSNGDPLGDPANPGNPLEVTDTSDAGTDPAGDPVASPETTETPDQNGNTDSDPTNDPTVFTVEPAPALQLLKSVSAVNDLDGDGLPGVGDEVVYSFTVTNVGNVDLADVSLTDPLGPVSGGPIDLDIGATDSATFTLTHVITATNIDDGAVENTATATGTAVDASGDPFSDPITGGDLTTSDVSDAGTEPEIGATGLPGAVTDPETTETVDANGGTDGDTTNDPTVLVLPMPELTVVKSTSNVFDTNGDGLFGGEDDEVTYQFTVLNTGNVDLVGITLTDNLASMSGGPIDLDVGAGDSLTFTASYTVTAADIARGYLENSAEATGDAVNAAGTPLLDLNGDPITVSDTSDTGTDPDQATIADPGSVETPDGAGATDGDPTNDPTVTSVPANPLPRIEIIKSVASVTDNGDGTLGAGDTVTYSFVVTNTGNVDLGDVTVTDPIVAVSGGPIVLLLGETDSATFTADYVLDADDVAAGGVENTAVASGGAINSLGQPILDGPGGAQLVATDDSDAGTEPEMGTTGTPQTIADPGGIETPDLIGGTDGDLTNDPTVLFIPTPSISVIKSLASAPDTNGDGTFGGIGDVITYSFIVENTGNTALDNIVLTDATADISGGPISLDAGEVDGSTFSATYTVTANDVNVVGYVENTANAFGDAVGSDLNPLGNPAAPGTPITVTDTSDTGTDRFGNPVSDPEGTETEDGAGGTDSDPTNDPTVSQVPALPAPAIEIIKSVAIVVDTDGDAVLGGEDDTVTYRFDVTNTGNTFLANVVVEDPLLGGVIGNIAVLAVGESASFTVDYVITPEDQARGFVENTATAEGEPQNPLGTPLLDPITLEPLTATDDSDAGTDSQAQTISDPGLTETSDGSGATDGDPTNDPTVISVPLAVPDTGISGIVFLDADQDGAFGEGDTLLPNYVVQLVDSEGNVIANTLSDANGFYEMTGFPIGTHTLNFIDPLTGEVVGSIPDLTFDRNTVLSDQNQALDPAASPDQLVLTKTTPLSTVVLGGTVPYQITVTNAVAFPVTANIVDTLPTGLVYLPDSALLDGAAVEPEGTGQTLTWADVEIGAGQTVTLELIARVGPNTPVGDLTNVVRAFDPQTGDPLATPAMATVRRNPEAVFDCSDIIGKVFDDKNFDGYQNAPTETGSFSSRGHDITDQDVFVDGKGGKLTPAPMSSSERGLPNVRLVTPTGTIITTDEYGRYSIPCAELPGGYGTNFTLKLDTRSLPTGYRVTTENPRTMRVTAGIMTELNFGAALGRVVDIDLTSAAFTASNAPVERLEQGIVRVLQQIASSPSVLRISYFSNGESREDVKDRLDQLEDTINANWRRIGDYRLIIERDVKYLQ